MEDIRTQYVEDEIREGQIKHWEATLSNAHHSVYVAQQQLEKLYRERYGALVVQIGHTAFQSHLDA